MSQKKEVKKIMAKLTAPLLSLEARGALGEAIVYFPWKGRNVARAWTKPANPRDIDQQIIRQKLAGMGKNTKAIETPKTGLANGSKIYQLIKDETPATQIWNAYFVKKALDDLKTEANFTELSTDLFGCESTIAEWRCAATGLAFDTLTGPAYATTISPELQFIMGAYAAYKLALSGSTSIYNDYPTNWTTGKIEDFATDYYTDT